MKVAIFFLASDKSDKIITYTVFSSEDVGFWPNDDSVENIVDLWVMFFIVFPCLTDPFPELSGSFWEDSLSCLNHHLP